MLIGVFVCVCVCVCPRVLNCLCLCVCVCVGHGCSNGGGSKEGAGTEEVPRGAGNRRHQSICQPSYGYLSDISTLLLQ